MSSKTRYRQRKDNLFYEALRSYIEALNEGHHRACGIRTAKTCEDSVIARDLTMKRARGRWDRELVNFLWTQRTTAELEEPKVLTVGFCNEQIKKKFKRIEAGEVSGPNLQRVMSEIARLERQKALLAASCWIQTGVDNVHQMEEMTLAHERDLDGG